jgi:menaquinone-dependent protoporphyrinogen IX oxidase
MANVTDLSQYDAAVIGAPMILGWHRGAMQFVETHQGALSGKPVAYFMTCLHLTKTGDETIGGVPVFMDPKVVTMPKTPGKLNFQEKQTSDVGYLEPILAKAPQIKPVGAGFFGGKLDFSKLNLFHMLFVRIIIRHPAGDFRNWDAIRNWAATLGTALSTAS